MKLNRVRRRRAAVVTIAATAVALSGCNREPADDSATPAAGEASPRIAIVTRNFTNPYWAALRDGALAKGEELGLEVNVQAGSGETDAQGENAKISTLANQDYDCFGVVPVNSTNVITPLVPVARQGIPILNLDTQIDPEASQAAGVSYASFIGSDNLDAGREAGEAMAEALGGSGKVAILQGIAGEQNGINRDQGFTEAVQGKLEIVQRAPADYDQAKGLQVTEGILRAHPDITGIFAANDTMGLGAAQAVENAGLTDQVTIISVDGIQAALQAVKDGTLFGTITQYPYAEGELAVASCLAIAQGKSIPERIVAPIALITADNVEQALSSFPEPFFDYEDPVTPLLGQ